MSTRGHGCPDCGLGQRGQGESVGRLQEVKTGGREGGVVRKLKKHRGRDRSVEIIRGGKAKRTGRGKQQSEFGSPHTRKKQG